MADLALITGATGIIGRVLAKGFLQAGWSVVCLSRSEERARSSEEELREFGQVSGIVGDLSLSGGVAKLSADLKERGLQPNALLNFARSIDYIGLDESGKPRSEDWQKAFDLEVRVPYELGMALAEQEGSKLTSIVNASSMYGVTTFNPNLYEGPLNRSPIHYAVVKAAVIHLSREMAVRLAPRVRVNCISYGGVEGRVDEAFKARYAKLCPSGRMLNENDISGPALFLASEASSGTTGHNLVVDGGWTTW